jgi:hypothetical protein
MWRASGQAQDRDRILEQRRQRGWIGLGLQVLAERQPLRVLLGGTQSEDERRALDDQRHAQHRERRHGDGGSVRTEAVDPNRGESANAAPFGALPADFGPRLSQSHELIVMNPVVR